MDSGVKVEFDVQWNADFGCDALTRNHRVDEDPRPRVDGTAVIERMRSPLVRRVNNSYTYCCH